MSEDFGNFKVSGFYLFEYKSSVWAQDGVRRITHTMEGSGNTAGQRGSHPPLRQTLTQTREHKAVRLSQVGSVRHTRRTGARKEEGSPGAHWWWEEEELQGGGGGGSDPGRSWDPAGPPCYYGACRSGTRESQEGGGGCI